MIVICNIYLDKMNLQILSLKWIGIYTRYTLNIENKTHNLRLMNKLKKKFKLN